MKRECRPITPERAVMDERAFIDELWTEQWRAVPTAPAADTVLRSDEYRVMRRFFDRLPARAHLLDGGCGLGTWTACLAARGFAVTGLDLSQRTLASVCRRQPAGRFVCGDVRTTPFADGSFDGYFTWGTFEHFEEGLGGCFREARRILKPDGLLFVSVPFYNRRHARRDARGTPGPGSGAPTRFYQWRLSSGEFEAAVLAGGFRVLTIAPIHKWDGVHRAVQGLRRLPATAVSYRLLVHALSRLLPARWAAQMVMAVAVKT